MAADPNGPGGDEDVLVAESVTLGYDARTVCRDVRVAIPRGSFTVILGPNACGKSTLLRGMARLLRPTAGRVVLDGRAILEMPSKELARRLGLLPQGAVAPEAITVGGLVARGRFPHQSLLRQWSSADEIAVAGALQRTGMLEHVHRRLDELSGGQRQRVWIAMVLAQQTELLLLDEPTTYLDVSHQVEVLELCRTLNRREDKTIVAVLHDLNQAARYADHLVLMKDGAVVCTGSPTDVITRDRVTEVFGLACEVFPDPLTGSPMVVPLPPRDQ